MRRDRPQRKWCTAKTIDGIQCGLHIVEKEIVGIVCGLAPCYHAAKTTENDDAMPSSAVYEMAQDVVNEVDEWMPQLSRHATGAVRSAIPTMTSESAYLPATCTDTSDAGVMASPASIPQFAFTTRPQANCTDGCAVVTRDASVHVVSIVAIHANVISVAMCGAKPDAPLTVRPRPAPTVHADVSASEADGWSVHSDHVEVDRPRTEATAHTVGDDSMQASTRPIDNSASPNGNGSNRTTTCDGGSNAHNVGISAPSISTTEACGVSGRMPIRQTDHMCMFVPHFVTNARNLMRTTFRSACLIVVATVLWNVTVRGQEIQATVTVNMDQIPLDQRMDVQSMQNDVRTYLNNQRFTSQEWEGEKIPVDLTIYLMSRNGNTYTARLAVVSKRLVNNQPGTGAALLRVFDQNWSFDYSLNPTLTYQAMRYDKFSSRLDFYMLMAIGMDMDTYDDLGGTGVFKAALSIAQLASAAGESAFNTYYQPGEITPMSRINEVLDIRYTQLRRLIFDYHDGVDLYARNKEQGREAIAAVLAAMTKFKREKISNRSVFLQTFFDAKYLELADIFRGTNIGTVWGDLGFLDPGNTQVYEQARAAK